MDIVTTVTQLAMDQTHTDGQAQANAQQLDTEITQLRSLSEAGAQRGYKEFWAHSKQLIGLFKTLKPLESDDRQRLWRTYREICDETHRRQTEHRDQLKAGSIAIREQIEAEIFNARQCLTEDAGPDQLAQARESLRNALARMKGNGRPPQTETVSEEPAPVGGAEPVPPILALAAEDQPAAEPSMTEPSAMLPRLLKEDREECWKQWQEVRQDVQVRLDGMLQAILSQAQELAARAQTDNPPAVLKAIREVQQEASKLGLVKGHREQLRSILNEAWKVAISRLQALREERKARHQEWRERMESNLQRWGDQVTRRDQAIAHLREQIEKLESMFENARTDEHRERVRTWIGETTEKLLKHEAAAVSIREKIDSVQSKLGQ